MGLIDENLHRVIKNLKYYSAFKRELISDENR